MNNHIECAEILEKYKCPPLKTRRSSVRFSDRNRKNVLTLLNEDDGFLFIDDGPYLTPWNTSSNTTA
ncbi:hypothetical protein NQ318_002459 [Aromia moschata]|uniref:Uncharacterized protein n=1 Tax=Aromia moschata TaxID=1265417 RepID=A0AAV8Y6M4_9CUCU|nr:hypothetical protein NQ318_002459 [Aromia moschata]